MIEMIEYVVATFFFQDPVLARPSEPSEDGFEGLVPDVLNSMKERINVEWLYREVPKVSHQMEMVKNSVSLRLFHLCFCESFYIEQIYTTLLL